MQLDDSTGFASGFTLGLDPDGREHVVVIVKASFDFPAQPDGPCLRAETQIPLATSDSFWGAPGMSAPRGEADFAPVKPMCDILLEAVAHAPEGRPVPRLQAGFRLGTVAKSVEVIGDRVWRSAGDAPAISAPMPFTAMPIRYDLAFGGIDDLDPSEGPPPAYSANPVGRGWHLRTNRERIDGAPLPNIEMPGRPVVAPWDAAVPMSFGPLGRGWPERLRHAGTYDAEWTEKIFPFLPRDFDPRYHQAAPPDQQSIAPRGGERVELFNLTPEGYTSFLLPAAEMPVHFIRSRAEDVQRMAMLDTITICPEARLFTLTWRASLPLQRDIFEVPECIIGQRSSAFWRARRLGKTYSASLGGLVSGHSAPETVE